jgi:tetratricopeptide (TPR) repeat protein
MLTGRKPFTGRSAQDVLIQKLKKKPEDISRLRRGLDPELCDVIMAGLKPDPEQRPQSAGRLKDALKKALDRSPAVEQARVGAAEDATSQSQAAAQTLERKRSGRSAWLWGAGAVILIAAGVAVGLGLKDLKSGKKPARGKRETRVTDSNTSPRPEPVPVIRDGSTPMKPAPPPAVSKTPRPARRPARPAGRRPSAAKLVARGRRLMGSGDYGAAKKLFLKARSMPAGTRKAQTALAELAFQQGQYKQAVRLALKAIKMGAGTRAKLTAANAYYRLRLYKSAALHYGSILAGSPGHRAAKAGLARCRRKMGIKTPPRP